MSSFISKFMVTALLTQVLAGCSTYVSQLEGQAFEPVDPAVNLASEQPSNGAIFRSGQSGLFATDQRARRVGDILTVTFNEIFAATKAQTAASSKQDAFAVTLPTGLPNVLTGGFDKNAGGNGAGLTAGTNRTFAGAGNAAQSNSFTDRWQLLSPVYFQMVIWRWPVKKKSR